MEPVVEVGKEGGIASILDDSHITDPSIGFFMEFVGGRRYLSICIV